MFGNGGEALRDYENKNRLFALLSCAGLSKIKNTEGKLSTYPHMEMMSSATHHMKMSQIQNNQHMRELKQHLHLDAASKCRFGSLVARVGITDRYLHMISYCCSLGSEEIKMSPTFPCLYRLYLF